jgi:hypothetical protein
MVTEEPENDGFDTDRGRDSKGKFTAGNGGRERMRKEHDEATLRAMISSRRPALLKNLLRIGEGKAGSDVSAATQVTACSLLLAYSDGKPTVADKATLQEPVAKEDQNPLLVLKALLTRASEEADQAPPERHDFIDQLEPAPRKRLVIRDCQELKPLKEPFDRTAPSPRELRQSLEVQGGTSKIHSAGSPWNDNADRPIRNLKWD